MQPLLRIALQAALALATACGLASCGGGGGGGEPSPGGQPANTAQGSEQYRAVVRKSTGTSYPVNIYLPPASAGDRAKLPVVYSLDGASWFGALAAQSAAAARPFIVVAIQDAGLRNRDFVGPNLCTVGGGGQAEFLAFLRDELIPSIEREFGGDSANRVLFGHSHGGTFVFYALFSEQPGQHTFRGYLASDASVQCTSQPFDLAAAYAAAHRDLPIRLHISYATLGNFSVNEAYANALARGSYGSLALKSEPYAGTHGGIVPGALASGIPFVLSR